jgi:hypothetical protein
MSEQTTSEQKALPPETAAPEQSSSAFGGRTDGSVGLDLGLAPVGLSSTQHADEGAPDSFGAPTGGVPIERIKRDPPPPREHPFNKRMREARERAEAAKVAAAEATAPVEDPEEPAGAEVQDAEFVERTEASA